MATTLFQLGEHQFNLLSGAPKEVERDMQWRWPQQERIMRKSAVQFLGASNDRLVLDGTLLPGHFGTQTTVDDLKAAADKGEPMELTDGLGRVYGRFAIASVVESRSLMMDTSAARKIDFRITLIEYGEDGETAGLLDIGRTAFASPALDAVAGIAYSGELSAFDNIAAVGAPDFTEQMAGLTGAGFNPSQASLLADTVGTVAEVPAAVAPFGAGGALTETQRSGWTAAGVNPDGLGQAAAMRQSPAALGAGLEHVRTIDANTLQSIAGPAMPSIDKLLRRQSTITPMMNTDPRQTDFVKQLMGLLQ